LIPLDKCISPVDCSKIKGEDIVFAAGPLQICAVATFHPIKMFENDECETALVVEDSNVLNE